MYSIYHNIKFSDNFPINLFKINLNGFNSLSIDSDIENLTDVLNIMIPYDNNVSLTSKELNYKIGYKGNLTIKKGDLVSVYLDFFRKEDQEEVVANLNKDNSIFMGFVKEFQTENEMITIICEDYMWLLKQRKINFSFEENTNSIDFIDFLFDESNVRKTGIDLSVVDADLGKIRSTSYIVAAEMLQKLKDDYKYYCYWNLTKTPYPLAQIVPKFHFGLKYDLKSIPVDRYKFSYPYDKTKYPIIDNSLNYQFFDKENELIVVAKTVDNIKNTQLEIATINGTSIINGSTEKGKKQIEIEANNREYRVDLNIPTTDLESLSDKVKETWNNHPESSFTGSFKTFGKPSLKVGDIIELNIDDGFGKMIVENYYVDRVFTSVNDNDGFTQEIRIGNKIKF